MLRLHFHQRYLMTAMLFAAPGPGLMAQESPGSADGLELPRPPVFENLENGTAIAPAGDEFAVMEPAADDLTTIERSRDVARSEAAPEISLDVPVDNPKESLEVIKGEPGGLNWRMKDLLPLLSVLLLIGIVTMLFKRFMPARPLLNGGGALEIVARLSISPKQTLVLVKVGRRLVLIGATAERITALSEVDDPDQVARMLGDVHGGQDETVARTFAASFNRESLNYMDSERDEDNLQHTSGQLQHLLDKLRTMARSRDVA